MWTPTKNSEILPVLPKIGGLILAGGSGMRMGGLDKGLQLLHGKPLIAHVLSRMYNQVSWWGVSANRHLPQYAAWGMPVWSDAPAWKGMGPVAALATAARHFPPAFTWVQCVACDMPYLPLNLTACLHRACPSSAHVAVARTTEGEHFTTALLPRTLLQQAADYLAAGERSLRGFLALAPQVTVFFDEGFAFSNINDLKALQVFNHLSST